MKLTFFRSIIFTALMLAAFVVTAQEQSELREKIMTLNKEMADLGKAGKFDAMQKYYLPDVISLPNNQPMMRGYKQIQAQHQQMVQMGIKVTEMEFNTTDLMVDGNMIVEIGIYKMSMTMPGLSTPMSDIGKYLTVWKKMPMEA